MTAEQSAAARQLLEAARRDWWQPGHPDFGITALDTESFALDVGGRRAKGTRPGAGAGGAAPSMLCGGRRWELRIGSTHCLLIGSCCHASQW